MAALDRLVWADGLAFTCYGLQFGVRVSDARAMPAVRAALPHGWAPSDCSVVDHLYSLVVGTAPEATRLRRFHVLYSGSRRMVRSPAPQKALDTLEAHLRLVVAEMARNRVFLHAGVVGWKGHAILLPGRTFVGKSTLVAELVKAGATYYSDEFAVLDDEGRVHPFHKPLSIRSPETGRGVKVPIESIGGRLGTTPLPVGDIFLTRYQTGGRLRPRRVKAARSVLDLLSVTAMVRRSPQRALDAVSRLATEAQVWRGTRGEAAAAARTILERCTGNR